MRTHGAAGGAARFLPGWQDFMYQEVLLFF